MSWTGCSAVRAGYGNSTWIFMWAHTEPMPAWLIWMMCLTPLDPGYKQPVGPDRQTGSGAGSAPRLARVHAACVRVGMFAWITPCPETFVMHCTALFTLCRCKSLQSLNTNPPCSKFGVVSFWRQARGDFLFNNLIGKHNLIRVQNSRVKLSIVSKWNESKTQLWRPSPQTFICLAA